MTNDLANLPVPQVPTLPRLRPSVSLLNGPMMTGDPKGSWTHWQRAVDALETLAIENANLRAEIAALRREAPGGR